MDKQAQMKTVTNEILGIYILAFHLVRILRNLYDTFGGQQS